MNSKKLLSFIGIIIFLIVVTITAIYFIRDRKIKRITTFEECREAGNEILESYPEQCKTFDGRIFVNQNQLVNKEVTITGELVCLPHKDKSGPQTLECAYGLKDSMGNYYGLSDKNFRFMTSLSMGTKITVKGLFTSETSDTYDVLGKIEIKELIK